MLTAPYIFHGYFIDRGIEPITSSRSETNRNQARDYMRRHRATTKAISPLGSKKLKIEVATLRGCDVNVQETRLKPRHQENVSASWCLSVRSKTTTPQKQTKNKQGAPSTGERIF
ncbi:hypothetical protein RRG08_045216 [Elysia crispata]|uniref:Uncharacterized protein n=1 Tax=Elysia crispata TaxID=231223 RepID=A0AAE1A1Q2_9GAST|nr:hypothetical protein RRG08_045216 [Elysia crispata]